MRERLAERRRNCSEVPSRFEKGWMMTGWEDVVSSGRGDAHDLEGSRLRSTIVGRGSVHQDALFSNRDSGGRIML